MLDISCIQEAKLTFSHRRVSCWSRSWTYQGLKDCCYWLVSAASGKSWSETTLIWGSYPFNLFNNPKIQSRDCKVAKMRMQTQQVKSFSKASTFHDFTVPQSPTPSQRRHQRLGQLRFGLVATLQIQEFCLGDSVISSCNEMLLYADIYTDVCWCKQYIFPLQMNLVCWNCIINFLITVLYAVWGSNSSLIP